MPRRNERTATTERPGEVLIAIVPRISDFDILRNDLWYRIPKAKAPQRWPPRWLAFYLPKVFGPEAFAVRYYGRVRDIRVARRSDLLPYEQSSPKADDEYYQIQLHSLERLDAPIPSRRFRRLVFISTTWRKLSTAREINDLFDDSPLEDSLWAQLKLLHIDAERQWRVMLGSAQFALDFAIFCDKGKIDVETDGDAWHTSPRRIVDDNRRNNALESGGWHVLRFNGRQIRESLTTYCLPNITGTINRLGGLSDEGLIPRIFFSEPTGTGQQLSLFEEQEPYEIE